MTTDQKEASMSQEQQPEFVALIQQGMVLDQRVVSTGTDEAAMLRACRARGLGVAPLAAYYAGSPAPRAGLVMGFAGLPAAMAADAARRLNAALNSTP